MDIFYYTLPHSLMKTMTPIWIQIPFWTGDQISVGHMFSDGMF